MRKLKDYKKRNRAPIIDWEQRRFDAFYGDIPASELPNNSVAYLFNAILFGEYIEARSGTRIWGTGIPSPDEQDAEISSGGRPITPLPSINGRDNYVASKTDSTITKTAGEDFTEDDILSWFLWPDGVRDLITEFVDADRVITRSDAAHAATTEDDPGKLQRPMNARPHWHNESRKCFFLIGETAYWTDYTMSQFNEIPCLSDIPYNAKSTFDESKGSVYLFNYNGVYKIDPTESIIAMYKCNDPVPENKIGSVDETLIRTIGRRYIYTLSRITSETGGLDRGNGGKIVKETGGNKVDENNDYNDYKEIFWQSAPKSTTGDVYQEVAGATPTARLDEWLAVADGQFNIAFTIGTRNVECDFTDDETWDDIAATIQTRLRAVFPENPEAECRYEEDNTRFVINEGTSAGNEASYTTTGSDGTDISNAAYLAMEAGTGQYLQKPSSHVVGSDTEDSLHIPTGYNQYTHCSIYTTQNTSDVATNPDQFAWNADIPVAKAFVCSIDAGGQINATEGVFSLHDVGSELKFQNGNKVVIRAVLSNTEARAEYTGTVYTGPSFGAKGAAIGNGRVIKAVQQSNDIIRISGDKFQQSDVNKMFFWSDGTFSIVKRYISGDKVETYDRDEKAETAGTIDPDSRNFNDIITDDEVLYRAKKFPLRSRFWDGVRNYGLGAITPGWMFCSPINGKEIDYSQLPADLEYLGGHHNQQYQRASVKDAIRHMAEFQDKLILYCANSTRKIATNIYSEIRLPEVGEVVSSLSSVSLVDPDVGIKDIGGVMDIGGGRQMVVSSEPAVRMFDGNGYSQDLTVDSEGKGFVSKMISKLQMSLASAYDPDIGYILWGSDQLEDV